MKKKLMSILTATAITLSAVPFTASAETTEIPDSTAISIDNSTIKAYGEIDENIAWTLDSNGTLTLSGTGFADPDHFFSNPFRDLADEVTAVVINDGITTLEPYLFKDFSNLKTVSLPDGLLAIYKDVFENCVNLTEINIPDSVIYIGAGAFENTAWLKNKQSENPLVIGGNVVIDGKGCKGDVVIPDGITAVGSGAFEWCNEITSVKLPDSLAFIGEYAFYHCELIETLDIPKNVSVIKEYAFSECISLKSIDIPDGVKYIYENTFEGCYSLEKVTLPESLLFIGENAFRDCESLKEMGIPSKAEICRYAVGFSGSDNEMITDFVIKGYKGTFAETYAEENGFKFVAIDEDTDTTEIVAQGKCGDATWTLDSNGTLIISEAGMGDGSTQNINKNLYNPTSLFIDYSSLITNVIVNEGITWIDMGLFKDLTELQSVILPESLKIIQPYAFQNCKKLTEINIPENVYVIKNDVFTNTAWFNSKLEESPLVIVNDIVIDGKKCKGDVEIPYGVTAISESAFEKCSDITSVKIPETVTKIPYLAFADCTSLKSVELSNGIKELGKLCFYSCTSLETINIPDSVEFIDTYALINCLSLKEIEIHENTSLEEQSIGSYYEEKHLHKISDFTIKGYNNSHAQVYAKYNGFNFVALDGDNTSTTDTTTTTTVLDTLKGDANCDGNINMADAVLIMQSLANPDKYGVNGTDDTHITAQGMKDADVNGDGVTNSDALAIQKAILKLS